MDGNEGDVVAYGGSGGDVGRKTQTLIMSHGAEWEWMCMTPEQLVAACESVGLNSRGRPAMLISRLSAWAATNKKK